MSVRQVSLEQRQTALLEICSHQAPVPADLPGSYSVTTETGTWTETTACVTVTETSTRTDLASFPFHFGWAAPVDLCGAVAHFGDGRNLSITFEPKANGSNDYAVAPLTDPYTYQIANGYNSALRARRRRRLVLRHGVRQRHLNAHCRSRP